MLQEFLRPRGPWFCSHWVVPQCPLTTAVQRPCDNDIKRQVVDEHFVKDQAERKYALNFGHKYVHIPDHYIREYDRLLMGGIWAQVEIRHEYDEEAKGKRSPFWMKA